MKLKVDYYKENPKEDVNKTFVEDGKEYTVKLSKIFKALNDRDAYKILRCKKERYGYSVAYKLKDGTYDDRDSGVVYGAYVYFHNLIK